jgi:hypothetical protein
VVLAAARLAADDRRCPIERDRGRPPAEGAAEGEGWRKGESAGGCEAVGRENENGCDRFRAAARSCVAAEKRSGGMNCE